MIPEQFVKHVHRQEFSCLCLFQCRASSVVRQHTKATVFLSLQITMPLFPVANCLYQIMSRDQAEGFRHRRQSER